MMLRLQLRSILTPLAWHARIVKGSLVTPRKLCYIRAQQRDVMARKLTDTVQLKLRFSEALRRRLEREAKRQEQSLNAEIIGRLEQTFRKSEDADLLGSTLRALFGGATGDLLRAIATAIWLIEKHAGKKWHEDPETALQVSHAIDEIIAWFTRQKRDPAMDAARLKYTELSGESEYWVKTGAGFEIHHANVVANTAVLETLQKM